jgi:putative transposase
MQHYAQRKSGSHQKRWKRLPFKPLLTHDCLNHTIVLGQAHLRRILTHYFRYYLKCRTHLSLAKDAPEPRAVQAQNFGPVIEYPEVGGLHHRYERTAA